VALGERTWQRAPQADGSTTDERTRRREKKDSDFVLFWAFGPFGMGFGVEWPHSGGSKWFAVFLTLCLFFSFLFEK